MQLAQSRLPPAFQFGGDIAVVRIDLVELALSQPGLVAQAFDLLSLTAGHRLLGLPLSRLGSLPDLQFGRGDGLEESLHDPGVDRVGGQALADRHAVLLAQIIADVAGAGLVLHHRIMAALAAINDAVEKAPPAALHMFTKPTGIFINPATCASTIAGTSRGRRQAPPHGAGPAVGV